MTAKTTYALLIYETIREQTGQAPTPPEPTDTPGADAHQDENGRVLAQHRALQRQASADNALHAVARLQAPNAAKTVRVVRSGSSATNAHEVTDGPFMETKEWLGGFYVVTCSDEEQALAYARSICPARHAIEVRPVSWHRGP